MKKITVIAITALFAFYGQAQNVGINTTGATPNAGAGLDIDFTNKGLLIPRVNIANLNTIAPIVGSSTTSMLVYNTNVTTGVGYYYWNGSQWVRFATDGEAWRTTGNAGTNVTSNFLGTTDNQSLVIRTNNLERMRIFGNGQTVINTTAQLAGYRFLTFGLANEIAITGVSSGNGIGVYGFNNNNAGVGGYFWNSSANGLGLLVEGGATSIPGIGILSYGADGMAGLADLADGTGVFGVGNSGTTVNILPEGSGMAATGFHGLYGNANTANGTGLVGTGNNLGLYNILPNGSGVAGLGSTVGVYGIANNNSGNRAGGIFQMSSPPPSVVVSGNTVGDVRVAARVGTTNYKIVGWGAVSTIVKDTKDEDVIMFAPEAPEVLFQDYGVGKLENGKAHIKLDPIFSKNINVSDEKPLKVFIQLEGECNGVYVTDKSKDGFDVIELNGGNSNASFSWSVVATRADQEIANETSDFSVRFPKMENIESPIEKKSEEKSLDKRRKSEEIKRIRESVIID